MQLSSALLHKYRKRFLWVSVVSLAVLVLSGAVLWYTVRSANPGGPGSAGGPDLTLFISLASLVTSIASFLGFLFTSGLAWRKEKRESLHSDVELERSRLEVEKLRLEVAAKQVEKAKKANDASEA